MTNEWDPMVVAKDLGRRYGERDALLGLDLEIPRGQCFGLFGHNGSGKTTFLKIVCTLLRPSSGNISVAGIALPKFGEAVRRKVGVLLDQPFLPPNFSLMEGMRYFADLHGLPAGDERILELLERVGLGWRRRDPVNTFSRGMGQRASLACALLATPELLILDEPFTGLDAPGCALVEEIIGEFRQRKRTVLLVTHELNRGHRLCDQLAVLDRGRVKLTGTPESISVDRLYEEMS